MDTMGLEGAITTARLSTSAARAEAARVASAQPLKRTELTGTEWWRFTKYS